MSDSQTHRARKSRPRNWYKADAAYGTCRVRRQYQKHCRRRQLGWNSSKPARRRWYYDYTRGKIRVLERAELRGAVLESDRRPLFDTEDALVTVDCYTADQREYIHWLAFDYT